LGEPLLFGFGSGELLGHALLFGFGSGELLGHALLLVVHFGLRGLRVALLLASAAEHGERAPRQQEHTRGGGDQHFLVFGGRRSEPWAWWIGRGTGYRLGRLLHGSRQKVRGVGTQGRAQPAEPTEPAAESTESAATTAQSEQVGSSRDRGLLRRRRLHARLQSIE